jgi:hypothetical protein
LTGNDAGWVLALQVDANTASYDVELVVTVSEAELKMFRISAAMMDKPSVTPVTRPVDVTVATSGFDEVHEIMTSATAKPVASRGTAWSGASRRERGRTGARS